ncbi:hypothetical protein G5714_021262 [Onychostoma macrolepis]|uniref:Secreted protein n=1 Tax=Onychostoma macrolepis TaxID=369639 RepID=A0A7J6BQN0_9TELE|nr:hypothetical protein G5714_021262 [Onychostoma macrolepis]
MIHMFVLFCLRWWSLIAAAGIFCICRKHKKPDKEVQTRTEEITYSAVAFHKRNTQKSAYTTETSPALCVS